VIGVDRDYASECHLVSQHFPIAWVNTDIPTSVAATDATEIAFLLL